MFAKESYDRLKARLVVDALRLDEELIQTPSLIQEVSECASDAIRIRDICKNMLDIAEAEAAQRLRKIPEPDGKPPSEAKVKTLIILENDVQNAMTELAQARNDCDYWQSLVDSMKDKGSATRRMADLIVSGYMTSNSSYEARREEINERRKPVSREDIKEKIQEEQKPRFKRR